MSLSRIFAVKQQLHTNVAKMHVKLDSIWRHTDALHKVLDDRPGLHDDLLNCMNILNESLIKWSMCTDVGRLENLVGNSDEPLAHTNEDWIVDENVLNEPPHKRPKMQQMRHLKHSIPDRSVSDSLTAPQPQDTATLRDLEKSGDDLIVDLTDDSENNSHSKSAAANASQDQYVPVPRQTVKTNGPQLGCVAALTSAKRLDPQYSKDQTTSACPAAAELVGPQLSETLDSEEDAFDLVVKLSDDNDGHTLAKKDIATLITTITDHFITNDLWLSTENARHLAGSIKKYYPQESVEKWTSKLLNSYRYKKKKNKSKQNVWQKCIIIGNCIKSGGDTPIDEEH